MKTRLRWALAGLAACLVAGASPRRASADPAVTSAVGSVPVFQSQSGVLFFNPTFHVKRDDKSVPATSGVTSFSQSASTHVSDPGGPSVTGAGNINEPNIRIGEMTADSSVSQNSTITTGTDTVSVESSAGASARKTRVVDNCCFNTVASATTGLHVAIVIAQRCHYQISASISAATDPDGGASAAVSLSGAGTDGGVALVLPATGGGAGPSVSKSGFFDAGAVVLDLSVGCDLGAIGTTNFHQSSGASARASWNVSFTLSPDAVGDDIRWTNRAGGGFGTDSNWDPAQTPVKDATHSDNAIFDLGGGYVVDFASAKRSTKALGQQRRADRIEVLQGDVTFADANLVVDELSLDRPSLLVDTGKLALTSGQLTSNSATIGDLHSVGAEVDVTGAQSRWDCLGRLRIGGSDGSGGDGTLNVSNQAVVASAESRLGAGGAQPGIATVDGASWTTGNFAVGFSSEAHLHVVNGGFVVSDSASIGFGVADRVKADAVVEGTSPAGDASSWLVNGPLTVTENGDSALVVRGGGGVTSGPFVVGGVAFVAGVDSGGANPSELSTGSLAVGVGNGGILSVTGGGRVVVSRVGAGAAIGQDAFGDVFVDGVAAAGPSTLSAGALTVGGGAAGHGTLTVTGGALVACDSALVGDSGGSGFVQLTGVAGQSTRTTWRIAGALVVGSAGGAGTVQMADAELDVGGDLTVADGSSILGSGDLTVIGSATIDGLVQPVVSNMVPLAPLTPPKRVVVARAKPASPPTAVLTIAGDLVVGPTGVVQVEAAGAQSDKLVVTGDATLDGKLVLQFKNGFAPKTGAQFEIFHVNGATTGAFASVETRGLAAGAQFDVGTSGGAVTLTAKTDAVALPTVSVKASTTKMFEKKAKKKATLTFARKGGSTAAPLVVAYSVAGSATNGVDYVQLSGTVTIPAKKRSAKAVVQVVDDPFHEPVETIDVAVLPGTDYTQSLASAARISIVDDD